MKVLLQILDTIFTVASVFYIFVGLWVLSSIAFNYGTVHRVISIILDAIVVIYLVRYMFK